MHNFRKVTVLGAGSFGTAFAQHLSCIPNPPEIQIFARTDSRARHIGSGHRNPDRLPGVELSPLIGATDSLERAITGSDLIVIAVPTQHVRELMQSLKSFLPPGVALLNLAKGIEKKSQLRVSQVISQELGTSPRLIASLGGPSFAQDIARGHPVGVTIGSPSRALLFRLQELLNTPIFDVKITRDIAGVEVGGALKNIFAIVAGVFAGCELGRSVIGDYFSRSMVEMRDIGMFLGGRWSTFSGRAGLGDLAITCGEPSRNFRFGQAYAHIFAEKSPKMSDLKKLHGQVFSETIDSLGTRTVEGFDTIDPIHTIIQEMNMFTPIVSGSYRLLYGHEFAPCELLSHIRAMDIHRKTEGPNVVSILTHELFPRVWYRRGTS